MATHQHAIIRLCVAPERRGLRLDRYLAAEVTDLSRQRLKGLITEGCVTLNGAACVDASHKLKGNEAIEVRVPPSADLDVVAQDIALDVAYEDEDVIVIDKPAGLVTHPAPGHASGTLVNALLAHCGAQLSGIGGVKRPGIVHRLDKDTSGLLVVAKSDLAHKALAAQFAAHGTDGRLERSYQAIVWGSPERRRGRIDAALGRSTTNRRKIAVRTDQSARRAVTHYSVLETFVYDGTAVASLVELQLETGRTHQIRVHMASLGHPLLGDATYGAGFKSRAKLLGKDARVALDELGRQALHAAVLAFEHPRTGQKMRFESALPSDFSLLFRALRAV